MDLSQATRFTGNSLSGRSSNGCWTCRLRRKKCDERRPVCDSCAALYITCNYEEEKPEWMDGGAKQQEMAEQIKREVKEKAPLRRGERAAQAPQGQLPLPDMATISVHNFLNTTPPTGSDGEQASSVSPVPRQAGSAKGCRYVNNVAAASRGFERSDSILLMFHLEQVVPFLFPYYRPSPMQGGKGWILEMTLCSPVVRQVTLCLASYFFAVAQPEGTGSTNGTVSEALIKKSVEAFEAMRQSLQVLSSSDMAGHLHGAVRILASIVELQRFEIARSNFDHCHTHLVASLALFTQILGSPDPIVQSGLGACFRRTMHELGPSPCVLPDKNAQCPSAEQAAFLFSTTILIFDDIISSTVLRQQPQLYEHHLCLLGSAGNLTARVNFEETIGCQNWALIQLGEVAALGAWKQRRKEAGSLDVVELVRRATVIKNEIMSHLTQLGPDNGMVDLSETKGLLDILAETSQASKPSAAKSSTVTRIWAHATLVYLFVMVSGWNPANPDIRFHVGQVLELLKCRLLPSNLLRTVAWPFCVAGCLAEPEQEDLFREVANLVSRPASIFGTVIKALEIMETAWRNRYTGDVANRDVAACFQSQGHLVLLV